VPAKPSIVDESSDEFDSDDELALIVKLRTAPKTRTGRMLKGNADDDDEVGVDDVVATSATSATTTATTTTTNADVCARVPFVFNWALRV
jgi:hypothetical protein